MGLLLQCRFFGGRLLRPWVAGATQGAMAPDTRPAGIPVPRRQEGDGRGAHHQAERLCRPRKVHDVNGTPASKAAVAP